jgi:hypothetical protein
VTARDAAFRGEDGDDPFDGLTFDESFVEGARTREPSFADRHRQRRPEPPEQLDQPERKIISLEEERARRMREGCSMSYREWVFDGVELPRVLRLPSPQLVAVLGALAIAALLLGGLPPFLR